MSRRLRVELERELEQLRLLVRESSSRMHAALAAPQDQVNAWDVAAMGAILHAFYNGVENCFKRIAAELDGAIPSGCDWHERLLQQMANPTTTRNAVVSEVLADQLRKYMAFRHFFRHSYSAHLRWPKMSPLVQDLEMTLTEFERMMTSALGPFVD